MSTNEHAYALELEWRGNIGQGTTTYEGYSREHLIRMSLRELLPQLDPKVFWQVHRGTVVRAGAIAQAVRGDNGKLSLSLHGRPESWPVSRLHEHRLRPL